MLAATAAMVSTIQEANEARTSSMGQNLAPSLQRLTLSSTVKVRSLIFTSALSSPRYFVTALYSM